MQPDQPVIITDVEAALDDVASSVWVEEQASRVRVNIQLRAIAREIDAIAARMIVDTRALLYAGEL